MNVDINTEIARQFGINAAIVVTYLWNEHNELLGDGTNNVHNKSWVRCSRKKLSVIFSFITHNMARRALGRLLSGGILMIWRFVPSRFDRTAWYAFSEHGFDLMGAGYERKYPTKTKDQ